MDRENFYILLELSYDPPVTDEGQIKTAISQKKTEWSRWQEDPVKRNTALAGLGLMEEINRVMLDEELRAKEAAAAQAIRQEMLRQFEAELRVLEGKGYLMPREAAGLLVKYKPYGVDREGLGRMAQCPITERPPTSSIQATGDILPWADGRKIHRSLAILGCTDLYEFLGEESHASIKKLVDHAEQRQRETAAVDPANAAVIHEMVCVSLEIFDSYDQKQRYDRFLEFAPYPELGDLIQEEFSKSGFISPVVLVRFVNFAVERYHLRVLEAEEQIRGFCQAYEIAVDHAGDQMRCPSCGNATDRDGAMCAVCSAPLRGECPQCGAPFSQGPGACTACGFPIAEMVKALRYIGDAENALIESGWGTARRCLEYAARYWPGHPKLETLSRRATELEQQYEATVETLKDCMQRNQFYAAQELVRQAGDRHMHLPGPTVELVKKVITEFEQRIAALEVRATPPTLDELMDLASEVTDSIELGRLMRQYPPVPPDHIFAKVHGRDVIVNWHTSTSSGKVEYVLVRKEGSRALTAFDGEVVYTGSANSFNDRTALPLQEYYYSIFVKRISTYSETAVTVGPVLIIPEIENLHIIPSDMSAQLSWDFNPDVRQVLIWRKLGGEEPEGPGDGIQLRTDRLDGYTDTKLKNDVEYWYYVVAVYIVGDQAVQSRGVCDSVLPHKMLAPIDHLVVARADNSEDEYVVNWNNPHVNDVLLLCSPTQPTHRAGTMLPIKELLQKYRRLDLDSRHKDGGRFRHRFTGGIFLFAASISGKFATMGEPRYLANVPDVEDLGYDIIGAELYLTMKWPAGLQEVLVAYRFDRFTNDPDEPGSTTLRCSREDYGAGILFKEPEETVYYFTVYSVFHGPDGSRTYSAGAQLLVNNNAQQEVAYKCNRVKRWFSSTGTVTVEVSSDEPFILPRSVIVGKVGRLPLTKTDGVTLFEVEKDTRVTGSVLFEYRTSALPGNLYVRMFFQDEERYEGLRLLPTGKIKLT